MTTEERVKEFAGSRPIVELLSRDLFDQYKEGAISLDVFEECFFRLHGHLDWQMLYAEGESVPRGLIHGKTNSVPSGKEFASR